VITNLECFRVQELTKLEEVVTHWPFFLEALAKLNKGLDEADVVSDAAFLRVILDTIDARDTAAGIPLRATSTCAIFASACARANSQSCNSFIYFLKRKSFVVDNPNVVQTCEKWNR